MNTTGSVVLPVVPVWRSHASHRKQYSHLRPRHSSGCDSRHGSEDV